MKKNFFFIGLTMLMACNTATKRNSVNNYNAVQITFENAVTNQRFMDMTKIFIDSLKCEQCVKEVFIDKIYEDSTVVTFKGRECPKDYLDNTHPLFFYFFSGKPIFVYSGIEELIHSDMKAVKNNIKPVSAEINYYIRLSFTLNRDTFYLNKANNLPFGLPLKLGTTPNIDTNKFKSQ